MAINLTKEERKKCIDVINEMLEIADDTMVVVSWHVLNANISNVKNSDYEACQEVSAS